MFRRYLTRQYQSLLILILITMLAVFAVTGYVAINNIVSEQSRIQQRSISPVYSLVNRELLEPLHIATTFAETITLGPLLQEPVNPDDILTQLARMQQRLDLTFFVALEKQRKQLLSDGRQFDLIEGKVFWYFQALESDKTILADLGQVGDVHLYFDVKIFDDNGGLLGIVGVGKRIKSFVESFAQYKQQFGHDFMFVNETNQIILTSLPNLQVTGEIIPELHNLPGLKDTGLDITNLDSEIISLNAHDVLVSEIGIPQLNWRLLLLTPLESRQAKLTKTFAINAALASSGIIVLITAMFMGFVAYKRHLEKSVEIDELTGLANRRYLQRHYQELKHRAKSVCLVVVDLDHFKKVNDTFGHNAGDKVLQETGKILSAMLRADDTVCRWGGEEFVMLIHDLPEDRCVSLIERAREALAAQSIQYDGRDISFTASFGFSMGKPTEQLSKLLANADVALYESKKQGRNQASGYRE